MLKLALLALGFTVLSASAASGNGSTRARSPENARGFLDEPAQQRGLAQDQGDKAAAILKAEDRLKKLEQRVDQTGLDKPLSLQSELGLIRGDLRSLSLTPVDRWRDVNQRVTQKLDQLESRYRAE